MLPLLPVSRLASAALLGVLLLGACAPAPARAGTQAPGLQVAAEVETDAAAFRALCDAGTFHESVELAGPEAGELLQRLATEEIFEVDASQEVGLLAASRCQSVLHDLEAEMRAEWDPDLAKLHGQLLQLRSDLSPDADEQRRRAAIDELVAFLSERVEEGE